MVESVDIAPAHRDIVEAVLREHLPADVKVWVFGSRADWTTKDSSDLDLALEGQGKLSAKVLGRLKDAFEDSELPYTVDVVDLNRVEDPFKQIIESQRARLRGSRRTAVESQQQPSVRLGDIAEIVMGQSPPGSTVSANAGVPLLNGPTEFGPSHPTASQFTTDGKKYAQHGDILYCVRGSTGRMNWADQEYAIGRGIAAIRHRSAPVLQPLVRAVLELELDSLLTQATGSVFSNVSARQLAGIPWPDLDTTTQHELARVFGILDDKIELNRQMSKTLEDMAQALFKSWFIDFDPVRAKSEGRPTGLPPDLDAVFPDRFVKSEGGFIPHGWTIVGLDEIAEFVNGLALQKYPPLGNHSLPVIKIKQLKAGHTSDADVASTDLDPKYMVKNGDILFSWSGSLECRIWVGGDGALNQHLFKVLPANAPMWFCYFSIHNRLEYFRAVAADKATTMGHIQRHHLSTATQVLPTVETLGAIDAVIGSLLDRSLVAGIESTKLIELRNNLSRALLKNSVCLI